MKNQTEVELKFLVPRAMRARVGAELARGSASLDRTSLAATYLDTDDRRLARAGLSWRLRREGRRWIQTLKVGGSNALQRFEHEAIRPDATVDASEHAGTAAGDQLIALLRRAQVDGLQATARYKTEVRRTSRRIRTRGAVVEVAFDEGRLVSDGASLPILEIEFELVSGSPTAMLALAERWRKRFGLVYDPHRKSERGDCLAAGSPFPPVRKAAGPNYAQDATATDAFGVVLDECLAQITRNAVGVIGGDASRRVEHVHQLRVGIRRLRTALRCFQGWVQAPPEELVEGLRSLFGTLGLARDADVLKGGVVAELAKAGAPPLKLPPGRAGPDPADTVKTTDTQRMLLAWIAWRTALTPVQAESVAPLQPDLPSDDGDDRHDRHDARLADEPGAAASLGQRGAPADTPPEPALIDDARTFQRNVGRRLRKWHAGIISDWKSFDELDDSGLHALRKRIKRQRYAVEFFAPLLRRRRVERYLGALTAIQDRMGTLNDLFVARSRYQAIEAPDPAAWFALGWLAARIAALRTLAKPELARLAKADPPKP